MQELLRVTPECPPPKKKGTPSVTSAGDEEADGAVDGAALEGDDASSPPEAGENETASGGRGGSGEATPHGEVVNLAGSGGGSSSHAPEAPKFRHP